MFCSESWDKMAHASLSNIQVISCLSGTNWEGLSPGLGKMISEKRKEAMYCRSLIQSETGHDPSDINHRKAER